MKLFALDPGTHVSGFAYFEPLDVDPKGIPRLKTYGIIRTQEKDLIWRTMDLNSKIRNLIVGLKPTHLVIEFPQFQGGSRGMAAARGGDTLVLAFLCGVVVDGWSLFQAERMNRGETNSTLVLPMLVTPSQWKGQISKAAHALRCWQKYAIAWDKGIDHTATDAVMLGDWAVTELTGIKPAANADAEREDR